MSGARVQRSFYPSVEKSATENFFSCNLTGTLQDKVDEERSSTSWLSFVLIFVEVTTRHQHLSTQFLASLLNQESMMVRTHNRESVVGKRVQTASHIVKYNI